MRYLLMAVLLLAMAGSAMAQTPYPELTLGGLRLVQTQNPLDGAWGWPLTAPPTYGNIHGPIGMGLCKAYKEALDPTMLAAIVKASDYLKAKTAFSASDGYLAAELDSILGDTANRDYVKTNFYDKLAAGTYYRPTAPIGPYNTATFVERVRTSRGINGGTGQGNLAAWDLGMGIVGASACGADITEWVAGTKAEINELAVGYYDVIGIAGGLYGLAYVKEEFDPTANLCAAVSNLAELADQLAGYQLATGGFTWETDVLVENDFNEAIQETGYSILALNTVGGYKAEILAAIDYMKGVQLGTGGWRNDEFSAVENNEVTGEAGWGLSAENLLSLDVPAPSLYVQPGEDVIVDMDVSNLTTEVKACQAMLGFSSTYLTAAAGCVVAGGPPWDELIYNSWNLPGGGTAGEIDTALGVESSSSNPVLGTSADGLVAVITLTAGSTEGATRVIFRPNADPDPILIKSTFLSDMDANILWPNKWDSQTIIIDGTAPVITCPADYSTTVATQSIAASATDALSGIDSFTMNTVAFTSPTTVVLAPGVNTFTFEATDKAGNVATKILTITYNQPAPTITIPKSVAPNVYGATSYPDWQANRTTGVLNATSPVGSGNATFAAVTGDPDYTVNMVTSFGSWLGILGSPGEGGNRLTYVYRIDNGVQANPGAAKLDLNKVSVEMRNYWTNADNPADVYMNNMISYDWATRTSPAEFGAGNARLKGFNWVSGAWVEVVGGRSADLIIFDNGMGYDNGTDPESQATLNGMYKQLSGAVVNTQYDPANTKRQTLTKDEYEVKYQSHPNVGSADVTVNTSYESADTTAPVIAITAPTSGSTTNNPSCTITGTATDNETLASGIREVKITLNTVEVYSNTTEDNVSFAQGVTLAEGTNTIVVTAKDFANNTQTATATVLLDTVKPTIGITDNLGTNPVLQGTYTVTVTAADAALSSGLDAAPVVKLDGNTLTPTSGTGPWVYTVVVNAATTNGAHSITADISDLAGNAAVQATRPFTVNKNRISGTVTMPSFVGSSRTVAFYINGTVAGTLLAPLSFVGGVASYTLVNVPDGTAVTLSAKTAWSLRQKVVGLDMSLNDGQATAAFTLRGGDLNGTNSINVLDYTLLKLKWLKLVSVDPTAAAADIDGNGAVGSPDYDIMKTNWFQSGDAQ